MVIILSSSNVWSVIKQNESHLKNYIRCKDVTVLNTTKRREIIRQKNLFKKSTNNAH